jgi:hypothetical protein
MTIRTIALPMIFLTVFRAELGGFFPAAVTDRTAVGRFDVTIAESKVIRLYTIEAIEE